MATKFTKLKPSLRNLNKGFTLVELLVTTLIATTVLGLSLGLIVQQRRQFVSDQVRTQANQTLRTGMTLIGTDIKNAGYYLENNEELPVVSVIDGGSDTNPDILVLQRKLIGDTLPVCTDVIANQTEIQVAARPDLGECTFSDGDGDQLTDSLSQAQQYRCNQDGVIGCDRILAPATGTCDEECVWAYIHDPVTNVGEFFQYAFENANSPTNPTLNNIYVGGAETLDNNYPAANNPIIYLLEERQYCLRDEILYLVTSGGDKDRDCEQDAGEYGFVSLVNQVENFQVQHQLLTDTTLQDGLNETLTWASAEDWQDLQFLRVTLTSTDPSDSDVITVVEGEDRRQLSAQFFPRNALSRNDQ